MQITVCDFCRREVLFTISFVFLEKRMDLDGKAVNVYGYVDICPSCLKKFFDQYKIFLAQKNREIYTAVEKEMARWIKNEVGFINKEVQNM